jgi:hypothetical protein
MDFRSEGFRRKGGEGPREVLHAVEMKAVLEIADFWIGVRRY